MTKYTFPTYNNSVKTPLLICPHNFKNKLLSEHRKDAFSHVKAVSKEELLNDKYGHYSKKAIAYLMINKNYTYEQSRTVLKFARFVTEDFEDKKLHELYELRNELKEQNLLVDNPYYANLFDNKEVHVYGYSKFDQELKNCIKGKGHSYNLNAPIEMYNTIDKFLTLDDEIFEMLNKIAKLIDEEIKPQDIYILTNDELVLYYIQKHARSFGLFINFLDGDDLFSTGLVSDFIKCYKETKDINQAIELVENSGSPISDSLVELIKENIFEEFSFEQQLDYLKNVFKSQVVMPPKYKNGINVISKPIYTSNAHIFVPNFVQGIYPSIYKDNEYLSDELIEKIHLNTSIRKCEIFEEEMLSFFYSDNIFFYSFSNHSFKDVFYESPWIEKLGLKIVPYKLSSVIYSNDMATYMFGKSMDLKYFYDEESLEYLSLLPYYNKDLYRNFDNKYTGVDKYDFTSKLKHSYSRIKQYCMCPFSYYLANVLQLDPTEQTFALKKGRLGHKVLEESFNDDFDFETSYQNAKASETWDAKEEMFLERFKGQLKLAVDASLKHFNSYMEKECKPLREQYIEVKIDDNTILDGFIDKCIILEDNNIIVVDYKTGSESFDPKYLKEGYSMQLPTYSFLLHNSLQFCQYTIAGLYINSITNSAMKASIGEDEIIPSYLKLNGLTIDDVDTVKLIDKTFADGNSKFIQGVNLVASGGFSKKAKIASKAEFDNYESIVKEIYETKNREIRENKFEISPSYISDDKNACKYCPYRDICYVSVKDRRVIKLEEEEEVD